jgi:hypothetical protein
MTEQPDHPKCHDDLKELARELRRPLRTLHALSAGNDPLMVNQPFRVKAAEWFKELYDRLEMREGMHIRQIFYLLVSQPNLLRLNGKRFENTVEVSSNLIDMVRDARYLDLLPANSIVDRRNPPPTINSGSDIADDSDAEVSVLDGRVESHEFGASYRSPEYSLPTLVLSRPRIGQRYHLEIWIEKSTANEILLPIGIEYGINVATFVGEVSVTACEDLVDRAIASGRPVRIFHITDFDPAGRSMPVAAAAKIDFYVKKSGLDLDIQLVHVALTPEHCVQYRLPRTPIKKAEFRGANFEAQFGEGATELDALEALHPGVLRTILLEHIDRYIDADLDDDLDEAISEAWAELRRVTSEVRDLHADEIEALDEQRRAIDLAFNQVSGPAQAAYDAAVAQAWIVYRDALDQARGRILEMEQRFIEEAEPLIIAMNAEIEVAAPDADDFDWPEAAEADDDDPLYDSTRPYVEQVDRFREHQGKDSDVRLVRDKAIIKTCTECGKPFPSVMATQTVCSMLCSTKRGYRGRVERKRRAKTSVEGQS